MNQKFSQIYLNSIKNPEDFWKKVSDDIFWFKKPTKILNKSNPPFYKWYEDGVTNTCYNALDFHIDKGRGDRTALLYDSPITANKNKTYPNSPSGMPGVQTLVPVMLNHVNDGKVTLEQFVKFVCENPVKIFGIDRKSTRLNSSHT